MAARRRALRAWEVVVSAAATCWAAWATLALQLLHRQLVAVVLLGEGFLLLAELLDSGCEPRSPVRLRSEI